MSILHVVVILFGCFTMAAKCLNPVQAWICGTRVCHDGVISPNIVFSANDAISYFSKIGCLSLMEKHAVTLPCGHCAACEIKRRKDWSVRLCHEASMHDSCCFITLTYDNKHVPVTNWSSPDDPRKIIERGHGNLSEETLLPSDVQKFIKRLRRHLKYVPKSGLVNGRSYARNLRTWFDHVGKIRYFAVGEYGSKTHRPHYHILIFGWKPSDLEVFKMHNGKPVYRSKQLEALWQYGFSSVSDVSPFVARYAARYVTKKFARLNESFDLSDKYVIPEFTLQSTRDGGIGSLWFDKFGADSCLRGFCTVRCGDCVSKYSIPQYYYSRLRKRNIPVFLKVREQRLDYIRSHVGMSDTLSAFDDLQRMVEHDRYVSRLQADTEYF